MQIVYHIGAHCTDEGSLLKSLFKNQNRLMEKGVALPNPGRYRNQIREVLQAMAGGEIEVPSREALLQKIVWLPNAKRVVMSNRDFICVPNRIFEGGEFYALAEEKFGAFAQLFPHDEVEIYLSIRDLGSFVPAAFALSAGRSFETFFGGVSSDVLYWSDLVDRIRRLLPNAKIVVWCNEDTPFIWPKLIRSMAGLADTERILGGYDLLSDILTKDGLRKLQAYMRLKPPQTERRRLKILAAFFEKYADDSKLEEDVVIPSWTPQIIEALSEAYEEDIADIAARPDVTFIAPEF